MAQQRVPAPTPPQQVPSPRPRLPSDQIYNHIIPATDGEPGTRGEVPPCVPEATTNLLECLHPHTPLIMTNRWQGLTYHLLAHVRFFFVLVAPALSTPFPPPFQRVHMSSLSSLPQGSRGAAEARVNQHCQSSLSRIMAKMNPTGPAFPPLSDNQTRQLRGTSAHSAQLLGPAAKSSAGALFTRTS